MPDERIRVLLVDDHAMVRRGMRDFLELHADLEVVGEAVDGGDAIERATELRPDVVVMDLMMPGIDGIEATGRIKASVPEVEIIAITSFIEEARVVAAIEAGASGFLLKDAEADELAGAIRAADAGEVHLDPAIAGIVARRLRDGGRPTGTGAAGDGRRHRVADGARARRAGAGRPRAAEPADRRGPRHHRAHRPDPRLEHPRQARARQPDAGGAARRPARSRPRGLIAGRP